jgi:hypothetical protein
MSLARDWTRQLYGAWGAALLAPVTMIAALAVLAFGGGFGGLSALGQLFTGPGVPVSSQLPGGPAVPQTAASLLPVVPTGGATGRAPTLLASSAPAGSRGAGSPGAGSRGSHGGGQHVGSGGRGTPAPVATPPPTQTQPPAPVSTPTAPPTSAPPAATLVNKVLAVGEAVTSKLPGPVGALGTGALQSLGETLSKLLPPL